jgi:hypothetical protein
MLGLIYFKMIRPLLMRFFPCSRLRSRGAGLIIPTFQSDAGMGSAVYTIVTIFAPFKVIGQSFDRFG